MLNISYEEWEKVCNMVNLYKTRTPLSNKITENIKQTNEMVAIVIKDYLQL